MCGVQLTGHGGLEKLVWREDIPVPRPMPGEVLVRVLAAGVNMTDLNTRKGWYGGEGCVLKKPTLTVGGCTYLLEQAAPIVVDDTDERTEELRKAALSKLTKAERAALGHA